MRRGCRYSERQAANVAQEINAEYGESMAYGFGADATSEQSVLALSRGVDEIFGRVDLWSTAPE
ncbi:sorbitol-6-phosphate 2-dehydrogenase (glucitol-6-phosphate dehydrogenase) [Escherichia coli]|uniref:Sorbitol-6-phosphate 2-dehydrogenase (Glucitol-6-phosphate dehydrogenase) n=1 Tax=Escherichia coli TaxID=562 RepID=A0A2X1Q5P0_ECOLX|nr:sorbitol-6-phosphate 2-dehydrogenase (glucitol-6-phosphate dehydrogenase) [Escherichia coli]